MVIPDPPPDEDRRLARLAALAVMDTGPEPLFDHLTALAAQICDTPVALLGLLDERRQWFKAAVGFGRSETPRARWPSWTFWTPPRRACCRRCGCGWD